MENTILITSVINTSKKDLPHSVRSYFTPEKRLEQTLWAINTIKKYFNGYNYYIVLLEGSVISKEVEDILKNNVNYYLNVNNELVDSPYKIIGEASIMMSYFNSDHYKHNCTKIKRIIKSTGRYGFDENYLKVLEKMDNENIIAQIRENNTQISTITYTIPIKEMVDFIHCLLQLLKNQESFITECFSIERYLYSYWIKDKKNIYSPEILGVEGFGSTNNHLIKY